ncbi:MAG: hypothetical protein ACK4N1_18110, partial [Pseudorhizobium sp.]
MTIDGTASTPEAVSEPVRSNDTDDTIASTAAPLKPDVPPTDVSDDRSAPGSEPGSTDATAAKPETVAAPIRSSDTDEMPGSELAAAREQDPAAASKPEEAETPTATVVDDPSSKAGEPRPDEASPATEASDRDFEAKTSSDLPHSAPVQPERKATATSALIAAGIAGGIVALALAGSMQYAGYLPTASAGADVTDEVAALRQQVETLGQAPAPDPEIGARLQAVEEAVAAASNGPGEELTARLSTIEQELTSLRTSSEGASSETSGRLDQLQQRLEAAEAELNEPGAEEAAAQAIAAA